MEPSIMPISGRYRFFLHPERVPKIYDSSTEYPLGIYTLHMPQWSTCVINPVDLVNSAQRNYKTLESGSSEVLVKYDDETNANAVQLLINEGIVLYVLLQIPRSSIIVPRAWLDLHLSSTLGRNDLVHRPNEIQQPPKET